MRKGNLNLRVLWPQALILALLLLCPLFLPRFYTYILAVIFVTALLAMSLNMVVGHGGLFQFHHGVFYGVGAYAFALLLMDTWLPMWLCFIVSPLIAAAAGFLIGWFCVRLTSLYFGMLQISLGSLIWAVAFRWYDLTHGDDGLHGVPIPEWIASTSGAYYFILFFLVLCLILMHIIHRSPFGTTMQAIRDNPARCSAVGINVKRHQLMAIVIATFFAGVAGVLFCRADSGGGHHRVPEDLCRHLHRVLDHDSRHPAYPSHFLPARRRHGLYRRQTGFP